MKIIIRIRNNTCPTIPTLNKSLLMMTHDHQFTHHHATPTTQHHTDAGLGFNYLMNKKKCQLNSRIKCQELFISVVVFVGLVKVYLEKSFCRWNRNIIFKSLFTKVSLNAFLFNPVLVKLVFCHLLNRTEMVKKSMFSTKKV